MAGFEAMLTANKNLRYQQNLTGRRIALLRRMPPQELDDASFLPAQVIRRAPIGQNLHAGKQGREFGAGRRRMRDIGSGQQ